MSGRSSDVEREPGTAERARSCLVLGSGRSGTSMLGGVLASGGFHMGERPLPGRAQTNAKGFYEDLETIEINEDLLAQCFPAPPRTRLGRVLRRAPLERGLRWAATLPPDVTVASTPAIDARLAAHLERRPFAYKDPRFAYTLPAWRPFIGDAVLVCIFREPTRTARSLATEWQRHPQRRSRMTYADALAQWAAVHTRILDFLSHEGEWLFVHYEQVLDGSAIPRLEAALGVTLDAGFADPALRHARADGDVGRHERELYARLCGRAEFAPAGAVA